MRGTAFSRDTDWSWREYCRLFCVGFPAESNQTRLVLSNGLTETSAAAA